MKNKGIIVSNFGSWSQRVTLLPSVHEHQRQGHSFAHQGVPHTQVISIMLAFIFMLLLVSSGRNKLLAWPCSAPSLNLNIYSLSVSKFVNTIKIAMISLFRWLFECTWIKVAATYACRYIKKKKISAVNWRQVCGFEENLLIICTSCLLAYFRG